MKTIYCVTGPAPDSAISAHLGRAPCLLLHDAATNTWQPIRQEAAMGHGACAGRRVATLLSGLGVRSLVIGGCGVGASEALQRTGVTIYRADGRTAAEAALQLSRGELPLLSDPCLLEGKHRSKGPCHRHAR
jgi:predicted Fe-Mo cluster-binding NifX family protein